MASGGEFRIVCDVASSVSMNLSSQNVRVRSARFLGFSSCLVLLGATAGLMMLPAACSSTQEGSPSPTDQDASGTGTDPIDSDAAARGDSGENPTDDASAIDTDAESDTGSDAGATDVPVVQEKEPNDTEASIQAIPVPVKVVGTVDPKGDVDAFRASLNAGDFLVWHLTPTSDLAPYLGVVEKKDSVPHYAGHADKGVAFEIEQFVTKTGDWNVIVSDWNNVQAQGTKTGGPTFGYTLSAQKVSRTPTSIAMGDTAKGSLTSPYAAALYAFSPPAQKGFDVDVMAKRKASPSDMDSRLTMFDTTQKKWVTTNDDLALDQSDSRLGTDGLPAGTYILVVENVNADAKDLSFDLRITPR